MLVRRLGFLLPLLLPLVVVLGHRLGGAWNFLTPAVLFVALPLVDLWAGVDTVTVAPHGSPSPRWRRWFDGLLRAWVPIQLLLLAWGAQAVAVAAAAPGGAVEAIGLTLSIGLLTGAVGITVAHELGHRRALADRVLACTLLATVAYAHFHVEHNRGHHARVATPEDPATAREGEGFWAFLVRTVPAQFASAWRLERERLERLGRPVSALANRMPWAIAAPVVLALGLALAWGAAAVAFFVAQAAVAVSLLELVNYVEHYGLLRRRTADGRYERVQPWHSWNAAQRVSNWYLFNLQRHSHHHANVNRRYEELEHDPRAPQLPAGYAVMVLVAAVPPLWRRVMQPRLAAWRAVAGTIE
jgi:alkane 1-monooxygenase